MRIQWTIFCRKSPIKGCRETKTPDSKATSSDKRGLNQKFGALISLCNENVVIIKGRLWGYFIGEQRESVPVNASSSCDRRAIFVRLGVVSTASYKGKFGKWNGVSDI